VATCAHSTGGTGENFCYARTVDSRDTKRRRLSLPFRYFRRRSTGWCLCGSVASRSSRHRRAPRPPGAMRGGVFRCPRFAGAGRSRSAPRCGPAFPGRGRRWWPGTSPAAVGPG